MTQAEKLDALVLKAQNQGFDFAKSHPLFGEYKGVFSKNTTLMSVDENGERWYSPWPGLLFNHDFARALFGEETILLPKTTYFLDGRKDETDVWMVAMDYRLQQAVISNDPIDYMYEAVFGDE